MMSLDADGKFIARCSVETIVPRVLREGLPRRTL